MPDYLSRETEQLLNESSMRFIANRTLDHVAIAAAAVRVAFYELTEHEGTATPPIDAKAYPWLIQAICSQVYATSWATLRGGG